MVQNGRSCNFTPSTPHIIPASQHLQSLHILTHQHPQPFEPPATSHHHRCTSSPLHIITSSSLHSVIASHHHRFTSVTTWQHAQCYATTISDIRAPHHQCHNTNPNCDPQLPHNYNYHDNARGYATRHPAIVDGATAQPV